MKDRFFTIHVKGIKQCQSFSENDVVHIFGKFTYIKVDGVETIVVS